MPRHKGSRQKDLKADGVAGQLEAAVIVINTKTSAPEPCPTERGTRDARRRRQQSTKKSKKRHDDAFRMHACAILCLKKQRGERKKVALQEPYGGIVNPFKTAPTLSDTN